MSASRQNFLLRLSALKLALEMEQLVDLDPTQSAHNTRARLLRNGLCVVAFTMLEDFIKGRAEEVTSRVGSGAFPFSSLPTRLQRLATIEVLDGLRTQVRRFAAEDGSEVAFVQSHAAMIASTSSEAFNISPMGFGRDASNLNADAIKKLLRTFQVRDAWGQMQTVASRIGVGIPSLEQAFRNASRARHMAAHQISADIPISNLRTLVQDALTLAASFDLLLSTSLRCIIAGEPDYGMDDYELHEGRMKLRFVDQAADESWACRAESSSRAWIRGEDMAPILGRGLDLAARNGEFLVVRNSRQMPIEWHTPDT